MNKHEWWSIEQSVTNKEGNLHLLSWYTCIQSHCSQHTSTPQFATVLHNPHLIFSLGANLNCHIVPLSWNLLTLSILGRVISFDNTYNIYGGGLLDGLQQSDCCKPAKIIEPCRLKTSHHSLGPLWHWSRCTSSPSPPHLVLPSPYTWPWWILGFNSRARDHL